MNNPLGGEPRSTKSEMGGKIRGSDFEYISDF